MRVFIFEDSDHLRGSLERALVGYGYIVQAAGVIEPLLSAVREGDVVVANGLRDAQGRTIPELLIESQRLLPVVQITGDPDATQHELATALLRKPFNLPSLLSAVMGASKVAKRLAEVTR